jgi:hypothetical protein
MALTLTNTQLSRIETLGGNKNYPAMYSYIASQMRAGLIAGATQDQIYWFEQAGNINSNNAATPASVFIRSATVAGLAANGKPTNDAYVQKISNEIGENVFQDIKNGQSIPDFNRQLSRDIGAAVSTGGMTIGGWGGAFYYWKEIYTDPTTLQTKTVGQHILDNPVEYKKFIDANVTAIADTVGKFGASIFTDASFGDAMSKALSNFKTEPLLFIELIAKSEAEMLTRFGSEMANQIGKELIKMTGYPSFSFNSNGLTDLAETAAGLFIDNIPGGGTTSVSEDLAQAVEEKLTALLAGKDTTGAVIYKIPSTTADGEAAAGVVIKLANGETISVGGDLQVATKFVQIDNHGNALWTVKNFDASYQTILKGTDGAITTNQYDARNNLQSTTQTQTFDDGSSLETTTLPNGTSTTRAFDTEGILTTSQTTQVNPTTNQTQQTVLVQIDDEGNTLITTTNANGSGTMQVLDSEGNVIGQASFQRTHNGAGSMDGEAGTVTAVVGGNNVTYAAAFAEDFGWVGFDGSGSGESGNGAGTSQTLGQVSLLGVKAIGEQAVNYEPVNASMAAADLDLADLWAYGGYSQNTDGTTSSKPTLQASYELQQATATANPNLKGQSQFVPVPVAAAGNPSALEQLNNWANQHANFTQGLNGAMTLLRGLQTHNKISITRGNAGRPHGDWLSERCVLDAANDAGWRFVA